ncbi:MAG: GNAT family N-acetyltransferase [Desulfuromonadales bacterium]|nr:GNAT family N-acetyltransferase [Desulfuromonadales bacterium]
MSKEKAMKDRGEAAGRRQWDWQVDWAQPADEAKLLQLFRKAFQAEMPVAQWRWKYATSNPLGSMVREGEEIIAFYGGMPRPVQLFGELQTAVQIGDVMVDPSRRGVLTKRGPFFLTASAFSEQLVGPGKPYCYAFGFPSERHYLLSNRLGLSDFVGEVFEGSWPALTTVMPWSLRVRPFVEADLPLVAGLWREMAAELHHKAVLVRDAAHLRHRYLEHPTLRYSLYLVTRRLTGRPLGVLVLRDHADLGVELLDVIAAPARMRFLVGIARRLAGRLGRERLFAWMTESVVEGVGDPHCTVKASGIKVPAFTWKQPVAEPERIRGHWWLMGGDADFR